MTSTQKFIAIPALGAVVLLGGALAGYAGLAAAQNADGTLTRSGSVMGFGMGMKAPHVDGTITAINGTLVTITADENHGGGTYTIETSGADIMKDGAASTLASFAVGEKIWAFGTISGETVTAEKVTNTHGKGFGPGRGHGKGPGMGGTVTAVSGTSVTVTGFDGTSYTVDASQAAVQKMVAGSLADIQVGDTIGVQGTRSGTTVAANMIMADLPTPPAQVQ